MVHGHGGVDELALSGPNLVFDVRGGQEPRRSEISADELGLTPAPTEALRGADVAQNAATIRAILDGSETGPRRDTVLLNSAAALVAADRAADLREGLQLARESLQSGKALGRLEQMITASQR